MLPDKNIKCHCSGMNMFCRALVSEGSCSRWVSLPITNPENGNNEIRWDCIDNHAHLLRFSIVRSLESNSAAIESMRNEAKKAHDENLSMGAIAVHRSQETFKALVENNDQKKLT